MDSRRRPRIHTTTWIAAGAGVLLVVAGRLAAVAQRAAPRESTLEAIEWDFGATAAGPMRAVALVPRRRAPGERFPLLIAFHGAGEAARGVERGAWGWARDYALGATDAALRRPRLSRAAFGGLVSDTRLAALRQDLRRRPYGGLVVVAPYTPDVRTEVGGAQHQAYERFVLETLLPRARNTLPVLAGRESTGVDGVSLGGLHALWIGLAHPETFASVGALQAAVRERQPLVAARAVLGPDRPPQQLRLVTSDGDPLRPDVLALSSVLEARGIAHSLRVARGPHDYAFNRGPGAVEMLLFHDRALRGETAP